MNETRDQPWMVREDWARGRIEQRPPFAALALGWGFVLFWNGFVGGMAYLAIASNHEDTAGILAATSPFGLVGLFMLVKVFKATVRSFKFGKSSFDLSTIPGVIGGRIEGVVHLPRGLSPEGDATLLLTCEESSRSVGQSSAAPSRMIWRDEQTLPLARGLYSIPVRFQIPYESPETLLRENGRSAWFTWTLHVNVPTAGVDFKERFEVPVYKTGKSDPGVGQPLAGTGLGTPALPPSSKLRVEHRPRGPVVHLPVRGILIWMFSPLLLLLVSGPISRLKEFDGIPFWMLLAGFAGVYLPWLALFTLSLVMTPSRIGLEKGVVRIRTGALGVGLNRTLRAEEITDVRYEIQPAGTRYNVEVQMGEKSRSAAYNLRRLSEAQWLVAEIRKAVGMSIDGR